MVNRNELKPKTFLFRAFMEVQDFYVCSVDNPDYILVKRVEDVHFTKVFNYELATDIWQLSHYDAKKVIGSVNDAYKVSGDSVKYRRNFNVTDEMLTDTDAIFESCFGGSQFIPEITNQFSVVKLNILDIFKHNGEDVIKLSAIELGEQTVETPPFHIMLEQFKKSVNMFATEQAVFADMQRSSMSNLYVLKCLYVEHGLLYRTLSTSDVKVIEDHIAEEIEKSEVITKSYENYLKRMKVETNVANAQKDAMDVLQAIN